MCKGEAVSPVGVMSQQLRSLVEISYRLTAGRALVQLTCDQPSWTGPAAAAYVLAVRSMDQELVRAEMRLDEAISETRQAIASSGR